MEASMKNQRKLMIAAGILTLFLIHLIAAFSLGIYIGRHGFSRQGLSLQGPQAVQQPPKPGGCQPGNPMRNPRKTSVPHASPVNPLSSAVSVESAATNSIWLHRKAPA